MKPFALVLVLLPLAPAAQEPSPLAPIHGRVIWTERPETEATISWSTRKAGRTHEVYYDVVPRAGRLDAYAWRKDCERNGRFTGSKPELHYHHALLSELSGGTTYYFVMASDGAVSREFHFATAPSKDVAFRLLAGGDSRSDAKARRAMNERMARALEEDPGILALCYGGDFVYDGRKFPQWQEWLDDHGLTTTPAGRMLPLIPARGNHERSGVQFDEVWNRPGGGLGKNYFATRLGPETLLVTLNSNVSAEGEQARFLEETLRRNADARWQMAQYHRPCYPAVKAPGAGKEAWVPIFERHDLDLALESDGHALKRTVPIRADRHDPTGVVYIGEGGLGVAQRTPDADLWYLQPPGISGKGHHVFVLSVSPKELRIKAVLLDGTVFDEHALKPRAR